MADLKLMFQLVPAIQVVFRLEIELTEQDFLELTGEQYDAYRRKMPPTNERVYRIVLIEPSVIERSPEKVTYELEIVTETEKGLLLEAVKFLKGASKQLNDRKPTFIERLDFLRKRFPREIVGGTK